MPKPSAKVKILTLGCAKNEVDSEEIAGVLRSQGCELTTDGVVDITIINTCGFVEAAKLESLERIRKEVRKKGRGKVVVTGCLVQRLGDSVRQLAPGADAYVGVGQMGNFGEVVAGLSAGTSQGFQVGAPHHRWADVGTRARSGAPWSAYLKVSEGCDHRCTFCTIPSFRGKHQSKPMERLIDEARWLVSTGAREICLIAQDVTQYGFDLYGKFTLPTLLRELDQVEGLDWLRILYFYPSRLTDEVIEAMTTLRSVLPYIDIPLQHVHRDVLRRMKRPGDSERYLRLFEKVRASMPDVAVRTTFIVGFPGETEAEFGSLLEFVREAKLDRVGAFMFSRESGTPAYEMAEQVPFRVKRQRHDLLMRVQQAISLERNRAWVGRTLDVLVDEVRNGWSVGRSFRDAPEIDGMVYAKGESVPGSIVPVKVTEGREYDLVGELQFP